MVWIKSKLPIISFVAALIVFAVPVMSDHSPSDFFKAIKPWMPFFYILGSLLFLYALGDVCYQMGRKSVQPTNDVAAIPGDIPAEPRGRAIRDLVYAANQISTILLEQGELRVGALNAKYPALDRDHDAWHNDEAREARNEFMALARHCEGIRLGNGPGWMAGGGAGDFNGDERAANTPLIEQGRDRLIAALRAVNDHI